MRAGRRVTKGRRRLAVAAPLAVLLVAVGCGSSASTSGQQNLTASPAPTATQGSPPAAPPGANGGAPGAAPGEATGTTSNVSGTAAFTQSGGSSIKTGATLSATGKNESAVRAIKGGNLALADATVTKMGDTSSLDSSSFYGLNAAVLATSSSSVRLTGSTVTASALGANGLFATGSGASVAMTGGRIVASGQGAHGVDATQGGAITLKDVAITTSGANAAALATDRGGGTITVTGGSMKTSGADSPGIYSTGAISVTGAAISASGAEAAVIEGSNSITLKDTTLSSSKAGKWGAMIYQSMSGDAQGVRGTFTMSDGLLTNAATDGPLFYITNSTGVITLKGVKVKASSGTLVKAASGRWGTSGSNGGTAIVVADGEQLAGNFVADRVSSITVTLEKGTSLTGAINAADTGKAMKLSLDSSSSWTVTADSHLTSLSGVTISGGFITNIVGNGHTVTYDAGNSANSKLGGKTYALVNGGQLKPA